MDRGEERFVGGGKYVSGIDVKPHGLVNSVEKIASRNGGPLGSIWMSAFTRCGRASAQSQPDRAP